MKSNPPQPSDNGRTNSTQKLRLAATISGALLSVGVEAQEVAEEGLINEANRITVKSEQFGLEGTEQLEKLVTLSGTVTDLEGKPLISATIHVLDPGMGAISDFDGNFELKQVPVSSVVWITYTGFQGRGVDLQELVPTDGTIQLDISLEQQELFIADSLALNAVIPCMVSPMVSPNRAINLNSLRSTPQVQEQEVVLATNLSSIKIVPNPVFNEMAIQFHVQQATTVSCQLYNAQGQLLHTWPVHEAMTGSQVVKFDISQLGLIPNHYYLTVTDEVQGIIETVVVIKQ